MTCSPEFCTFNPYLILDIQNMRKFHKCMHCFSSLWKRQLIKSAIFHIYHNASCDAMRFNKFELPYLLVVRTQHDPSCEHVSQVEEESADEEPE